MASELPFATMGEPQATDSPAAAIAAMAANLSPHSFSTLRFATEGRASESEGHTPPARGMNQPGTISTPTTSSTVSRTSDVPGAAEFTPGGRDVTVGTAGAGSALAPVSFGRMPTVHLPELRRHATNSDAATLVIGQSTRPENKKLTLN